MEVLFIMSENAVHKNHMIFNENIKSNIIHSAQALMKRENIKASTRLGEKASLSTSASWNLVNGYSCEMSTYDAICREYDVSLSNFILGKTTRMQKYKNHEWNHYVWKLYAIMKSIADENNHKSSDTMRLYKILDNIFRNGDFLNPSNGVIYSAQINYIINILDKINSSIYELMDNENDSFIDYSCIMKMPVKYSTRKKSRNHRYDQEAFSTMISKNTRRMMIIDPNVREAIQRHTYSLESPFHTIRGKNLLMHERSGISMTTLVNFEHGLNSKILLYAKLCEAYCISFSDFLNPDVKICRHSEDKVFDHDYSKKLNSLIRSKGYKNVLCFTEANQWSQYSIYDVCRHINNKGITLNSLITVLDKLDTPIWEFFDPSIDYGDSFDTDSIYIRDSKEKFEKSYTHD